MMCPHSTAITNENGTENERLPKSLIDYSPMNQGFRIHVAVHSSWRSESNSSLSLVHDKGDNNIGKTAIRGDAKDNQG